MRAKPMTWRLRFMPLRVYPTDALDPALWNARSDSANCRHDGSSRFCLTCTTA